MWILAGLPVIASLDYTARERAQEFDDGDRIGAAFLCMCDERNFVRPRHAQNVWEVAAVAIPPLPIRVLHLQYRLVYGRKQ